jgi:hypothetical protein
MKSDRKRNRLPPVRGNSSVSRLSSQSTDSTNDPTYHHYLQQYSNDKSELEVPEQSPDPKMAKVLFQEILDEFKRDFREAKTTKKTHKITFDKQKAITPISATVAVGSLAKKPPKSWQMSLAKKRREASRRKDRRFVIGCGKENPYLQSLLEQHAKPGAKLIDLVDSKPPATEACGVAHNEVEDSDRSVDQGGDPMNQIEMSDPCFDDKETEFSCRSVSIDAKLTDKASDESFSIQKQFSDPHLSSPPPEKSYRSTKESHIGQNVQNENFVKIVKRKEEEERAFAEGLLMAREVA